MFYYLFLNLFHITEASLSKYLHFPGETDLSNGTWLVKGQSGSWNLISSFLTLCLAELSGSIWKGHQDLAVWEAIILISIVFLQDCRNSDFRSFLVVQNPNRLKLILWLIHLAYAHRWRTDVSVDHRTFVPWPVEWPLGFILSQVGGRAALLRGPHCGLARPPSRRSLDPVSSLQMSLAFARRVSPQRLLVHRGPYQLLMRPCLGSQTGSFLQPRAPACRGARRRW